VDRSALSYGLIPFKQAEVAKGDGEQVRAQTRRTA
jgi:hypothetical protein